MRTLLLSGLIKCPLRCWHEIRRLDNEHKLYNEPKLLKAEHCVPTQIITPAFFSYPPPIRHATSFPHTLFIMADQNSRFAWTTGGDTRLSHRRWIETGGSGAVHEVFRTRNRLLTCSSTMRKQAKHLRESSCVSYTLNRGRHEMSCALSKSCAMADTRTSSKSSISETFLTLRTYLSTWSSVQ